MPGVESKALYTRFLQGLAQGGFRKPLRSLVMPARLQPSREGAVMDQQNPSPFPVQNEGRCSDVSGKRAAGMDVVPALDLTPQQGMPVGRHGEGTSMLIEHVPDLSAEGRRIEGFAHFSSITFAKASL
jgi:hypothetical protein